MSKALLTQSEIELVRAGYARFSKGDVRGVAEILDPDVEYVLPDDFPEGMGGVFHGRQEVLRMWESMLTELEYWRAEAEKIIHVPPDRLLVLARVSAKGKASGAEIQMQTADLLTVRNSRIVRVHIYRDPHEALRTVGIEDRPSVNEGGDDGHSTSAGFDQA
jgi:ketosteroid isomerase-like protein